MRISHKLALGFIGVAGLLAVSGYTSFKAVGTINRQIAISADYKDLIINIIEARAVLTQYLNSEGQAQLIQLKETIARHDRFVEMYIERLTSGSAENRSPTRFSEKAVPRKSLSLSPEISKIIKEVKKLWEESGKIYDDTMQIHDEKVAAKLKFAEEYPREKEKRYAVTGIVFALDHAELQKETGLMIYYSKEALFQYKDQRHIDKWLSAIKRVKTLSSESGLQDSELNKLTARCDAYYLVAEKIAAITMEIKEKEKQAQDRLVSLDNYIVQLDVKKAEIEKAVDSLVAKTTDRAFKNLIMGIIIIFILFLSISLFLFRFVSVPLNRLKEASADITKGKFDTQISITSQDEIGQLTAAFNLMTDSLHKAIVSRDQEIVMRRQTEESLKNSEGRLSATLMSIGDAVITTDKEGKIVLMNTVAESLTGWKLEEAVGRYIGEIFRIVDEYSEKPLENPVKKALKEGIIAGLANHAVLITRSGKKRPIEDSGAPIIISEGIIIGVVLVFRDVTESRKVQADLRRSENKYRTLLENMLDVIYSLNKEGEISSVNKAVKIMLGYEPEEIIGKNVIDIVAQEALGKTLEDLKKVMSGNKIMAETILLDKQGRPHHIESSTSPMLEEGVIVGVQGVLRDITTRKKAEESIKTLKQQIEFILGATKTGLDIIDSDFNLIYVDPEWQKVYGEPSGKKCYTYFMGRSEICPDCGIVKALKNKKIIVTEEVLVRENNRPIQVTTIPFQNEKGEWLVAEVNVDITERKKAEEEKDRLLRQLNQAHKLESIGTLAAGIAHEINTPIQFIRDNTEFMENAIKDLLRIVTAYQEFLLEKKADKNIREIVDKGRKLEEEKDLGFLAKELPQAAVQSKEGLERVSKIVKAMKDFSHIGMGDEKEKVDINEAIRTTITISRNEYKYIAELKTDLDTELPLVACFIGDIKQVILNLIVNAAHAVADKLGQAPLVKGLIIISTRKEKDQAVIEVKDTGCGILPEVKDKIFDPFFTTKEVGKGTGQGLTIAYDTIVKKHGGSLDVITEPGQGSTFSIRLPLGGS